MAEKREKTKITIPGHPEFPVTNDGAIMTSTDISKHVNALFKRIFADYAGCRVFVDQTQDPSMQQLALSQAHPVQLELYFTLGKPVDTDKRLVAFRQLTDKARESAGNTKGRMNYIQMAMGYNVAVTNNKSSEITQEAIDVLGDMLWYDVAMNMSMNPSAKEFNNKGIIVEASTTDNGSPYGGAPYLTPNTQRIVYNIVRCIDINSVLALLFSDDDNDPMIYNVTPLKPVIPTMNGFNVPNITEQKWLFSVNRINKQNFYDLCNELGTFNTTGGLNICTDSF